MKSTINDEGDETEAAKERRERAAKAAKAAERRASNSGLSYTQENNNVSIVHSHVSCQ